MVLMKVTSELIVYSQNIWMTVGGWILVNISSTNIFWEMLLLERYRQNMRAIMDATCMVRLTVTCRVPHKKYHLGTSLNKWIIKNQRILRIFQRNPQDIPDLFQGFQGFLSSTLQGISLALTRNQCSLKENYLKEKPYQTKLGIP